MQGGGAEKERQGLLLLVTAQVGGAFDPIGGFCLIGPRNDKDPFYGRQDGVSGQLPFLKKTRRPARREAKSLYLFR
jgi:hypothetical protein